MARIVAACDRALLVTFSDRIEPGAAGDARRLALSLARHPIPGVVDAHLAYASVLVTFEPLRLPAGELEEELVRRLAKEADEERPAPRTVIVPVRYGKDTGPDLEEVARQTGLAPAEVVRRHAAPTYEVVFLGFTPGFPYLAGLPAELATRRRAEPRVRVEPGSVAIAGIQAGIYPVASPGGWNVIGRTALPLFAAEREPPALLAPGDLVRFVPEEDAG